MGEQGAVEVGYQGVKERLSVDVSFALRLQWSEASQEKTWGRNILSRRKGRCKCAKVAMR